MTTARLAPELGVATACDALGLSRATFYRQQKPAFAQKASSPRPPHPRALA